MRQNYQEREEKELRRLPFLFAVSGVKNSGKTTLIEKLIPALKCRGQQVAVIKRDGHEFEADVPGTDSYRHKAAGAYGSAIFSQTKLMLVKEQPEISWESLAEAFPEADIILLEGFKQSRFPKVELVRKGNSERPVCAPETLRAIISDFYPGHDENVPILGFDEIGRLTDLILAEKHRYLNGSSEMGLTHFDENGKAVMVDVTEKAETAREAAARGRIVMNQAAFDAVCSGTAKKGDVLGVAATAGIMGAKSTAGLIPMCHILPLTNCRIEFEKNLEERSIECTCTVKVTGKTGVEMEALTGVSIALLTIYDMCKAVDHFMEIGEIRLLRKSGGKSGLLVNEAGWEEKGGGGRI